MGAAVVTEKGLLRAGSEVLLQGCLPLKSSFRQTLPLFYYMIERL